MRISNLIRVFEDIVVNTGGKVVDATRTLYTEVEQEARARALYRIETKADREMRLDDLREAIKAVDTLHIKRARNAASRKPRVSRAK